MKKLLTLIPLLYLLDQVTKWLVVFNYVPPRRITTDYGTFIQVDQTTVIPHFFNIVRVHNTGVAWGFGNGEAWATYVFLCIPIIALGVILYLFYTKKVFTTPLLKLCGVLILSGILGNLSDRLVQGFILPGAENLTFCQNLLNGYVVDFIDITIPFINYRWPAFNVADSCISIAACLIVISSLFTKNKGHL